MRDRDFEPQLAIDWVNWIQSRHPSLRLSGMHSTVRKRPVRGDQNSTGRPLGSICGSISIVGLTLSRAVLGAEQKLRTVLPVIGGTKPKWWSPHARRLPAPCFGYLSPTHPRRGLHHRAVNKTDARSSVLNLFAPPFKYYKISCMYTVLLAGLFAGDRPQLCGVIVSPPTMLIRVAADPFPIRSGSGSPLGTQPDWLGSFNRRCRACRVHLQYLGHRPGCSQVDIRMTSKRSAAHDYAKFDVCIVPQRTISETQAPAAD